MKRILLFILFALMALNGFSQSRREWLQYADEAFNNGDYASAAYFYQKVLDKKAAGSRDIVYPYDAKPWIKPEKIKTDTLAGLAGDSIAPLPDRYKVADLDSNGRITQQELKAVTEKVNNGSVTLTADDLKELSKYIIKPNAVADTSSKGKKQPQNIITAIRYPYVVHQIAESYRLNHDYANAAIWYERSLLNRSPQFPDERFYYALTLISNGKYEQAVQELETYKKETTDTTGYMTARADKMLLGCYFGMDPGHITQGMIVEELDSTINSGTSNFGMNFYGDHFELVFTSGRNGNQTPEGEEENARFYSDLYTVKRIEGGFTRPQPLSAPINSEAFEANGTLSINKNLFFFTRWSGQGKKETAIYVSRFFNNQWLPALKLNNHVNMEGYSSMHPWLSFDGTRLYFSSNRPGGKGKMDIWMCPLDEAGNAGPAVNLGPAINTTENEVSPAWHDKTTTLYFSSDGHIGLGGLDVYKAYATDEDTIWNTPINMGAPVNSNRDDSYFILQRDQRIGYFSSDRKPCEGCEGGACYRIYKIEKEPLAFNISGIVFNSETNEPIPNSLLTFKDVADNLMPFYIITDENGAYSSILREDMEFFIKAQKNKFFGDAASVSTKGLTESKDFEQDFFLMPIPVGDIVIPGIEYDYNSSNLRPESKLILDSLVDFLNLNNNISIEISSHTDTRGSDEYNLKLSNDRAQSVVDYLISKGIDPERLIAQGYGETKPLVSDAEIAKLRKAQDKEAAHQKNRRTAFRTTREDAIRSN